MPAGRKSQMATGVGRVRNANGMCYHPNSMGASLREALDVGEREVIVFVGAGGKTTTMYRLASELHDAGRNIVVTTTTKMFPPTQENVTLIVETDPVRVVKAISEAHARGQVPVVARAITPEGKLDGVPPAWVRRLAEVSGVSYVLVEGDGAARKPFTAPREYEPVIPDSATVVVPIVGVDALGQPLSLEVAHRPERVTALTGLEIGSPIDARSIATVMLSPEGNVKGAPPTARIVPLINKVDSPERREGAKAIAAELHKLGAKRVILAAVGIEPPVIDWT